MSVDNIEVGHVAEVCKLDGVEIRDLRKVRDRVLRGVLDGTMDVYVKLYRPEKQENILEVLEGEYDVGLPACRLAVSEDFLALVMDAVEGRPLSHVLPVALVPGMWRLSSGRMGRAYRQIGTYLGRLHAKTATEAGPLLMDRQLARAIERVELLDGRAPEGLVPELEAMLRASADTPTEQSIVHSDPSPHNVIYDGGRTRLIDYSFSRRAAAHDHANVLLGVRLMVGRLPYARASAASLLEEAYWEGYRATGISATARDEVVGPLLCYKHLSLLEHYAEGPETIHGRLTRYTDESIILDELERIARSTET